MLNFSENIRIAIGMDANSFYACFAPIVVSIIIPVFGGTLKIIQNIKNANVWNLYCRSEGDLFYPMVMFLELVLSLFVFITMVIVEGVLSIFKCSYCATSIVLLCLMLFLTVRLIKFTLSRIFVRKRIIGSKKEKYLIWLPGIIYNMFFFSVCLNMDMLFYPVLLLVFMVTEIFGVYVFRERYIEYKYSSMTFYLNDKSVIDCKDITKIVKKYNSFIINEDEKQIKIKFDNISRVEYYGGMAIKLIGENCKVGQRVLFRIGRKREKKGQDK